MKSLEELPPLPDENGQLLLDEVVREAEDSPPEEE